MISTASTCWYHHMSTMEAQASSAHLVSPVQLSVHCASTAESISRHAWSITALAIVCNSILEATVGNCRCLFTLPEFRSCWPMFRQEWTCKECTVAKASPRTLLPEPGAPIMSTTPHEGLLAMLSAKQCLSKHSERDFEPATLGPLG